MPPQAAKGPAPRPKHPSKPLSVREESFCQGIVQGLTKKAAYFAAGYAGTNAKSQSSHVSQLLKIPEIHYRILWLRMRQAQRLNVTVDSLMLELAEAYEIARVIANPQGMVAATMAKAKLMGFLNDDSRDPDTRVPLPSPIPTDVVELTREQWEEQFKPKMIQ